MANRLAYGALAITAVFALIIFDASLSQATHSGWTTDLLCKGSLLPIAFTVLSLVAAVELGLLMRRTGLRPLLAPAVVAAGLLMLAPWLINGLLIPQYMADMTGTQWELAVLVVALLVPALGLLRRRDFQGALADLGATWLIILYAGFLPSFVLQVRCHQFLYGPEGAWLVLIFLVVVKVSDIGAFFIGSACGRHRLIPWVSPKKTIEGALGGILASILAAWLFWMAYDWTSAYTALPNGGRAPMAAGTSLGELFALLRTITEPFHALKMWQAIVFGALMSIVGQLGDLLESTFKRAAEVKDSARLLPTFGGVLDIIDSPVLAAPVAWFLFTCLWPVV